MKSKNAAMETLRESSRKIVAAQSERHAYLSKLYGIKGTQIDVFDDLENENLYPSNRYFPITFYYDPDRIAEQKLEHQYSLAKRKYRHRVLRKQPLDLKALRKFSVSHGPRFESIFLENGYATDLDGRTFIGRGRPKSFKVVEANKTIVQANAHLWTTMLAECSQPLFEVNSPDEIKALAAAMLGMAKKGGRLIPLVPYKNLFLGAHAPVGYPFYFAHSMTPLEAIKEGKRTIELLFTRVGQDAMKQIEFEFANAHILFGGGARISLKDHHKARASIVVWFSQVLATQRRVVWGMEIRRTWAVELRELLNEKKIHKRVLGAPMLSEKHIKSKTVDEQIDFETDVLQGEAEDIWGYRPDCMHELSLEERMLAVLHGISVDSTACSEYDFIESKEYLIALARWIGALKRTGVQTFDEHIARYVRLGWNRIGKGDNCLLGQFPKATWLTLVNMAGKEVMEPPRTPYGLPRRRIDGYAGRFDVTYEWVTINTIHNPTACTWENGALSLRGPLLCFPTDQIAYWKRKASIVTELRGFLAPDLQKKREPGGRYR
jgi:hypothetical protein